MEEYLWYIGFNNKVLGPFSSIEVVKNPLCSLDLLVWREGFKKWVPLKTVPELLALYKKVKKGRLSLDENQDPLQPQKVKKKPLPFDDELTLDLKREPPFLKLLILLILSLLIFFAFQNL